MMLQFFASRLNAWLNEPEISKKRRFTFNQLAALEPQLRDDVGVNLHAYGFQLSPQIDKLRLDPAIAVGTQSLPHFF